MGDEPKPVSIKILLDSGASASLINGRFVEKLHVQDNKRTKWTTTASPLSTTKLCKIQFSLPELLPTRLVKWKVHVDASNQLPYDMILGRDLLHELGLNLNFEDKTVQWEQAKVPMHDTAHTSADSYAIQQESPSVTEATERIQRILDAKYEPANLKEIVELCKHLNDYQQSQLLELLSKYESLFDGSLGHWRGATYNVELKPNVSPYHARPYPIPHKYEHTLKLEVERLCKEGVLKKVNRSEWASPTFIIPKKDGTVRFISDFRELNKRIRRKPFPLPKIQDLLMKLEGFQYATSLDLNMGYYHRTHTFLETSVYNSFALGQI